MAGEPLHITGPELNGHVGEAMFYSRPLVPLRIEEQGDNIVEFVMHPPHDNLPLETKVYSTLPLVIPDGFVCQMRYRQLEEGEAPPFPYPNPVLINPSRGTKQSLPEPRPTHGAVKAADQEVLDWQNAYGAVPIHSDQAMYTAGAGCNVSEKPF